MRVTLFSGKYETRFNNLFETLCLYNMWFVDLANPEGLA